ncbi:hypothetical protein C8R43DRAFT_1112024 [Mycena crocata]|nr:hypothetical protein C8R43DRAFT_1112024 [Mycena crocata]
MPPELPWFKWLPVGGVLAVDRNADSPSPCSGFGQEGSGMADMYVDSIRADTGYSFSYDASETETRKKVKDVAWNSSYCGLSGQLLEDGSFTIGSIATSTTISTAVYSIQGGIRGPGRECRAEEIVSELLWGT